jgi:hypothetical protein
MKKTFLMPIILFVALMVSTITSIAQEGRKIIAVVNKAEWCHVCQANGARLMNELMPMFATSNVQFVMNDLTNTATKAESKKKLADLHVYKAAKKVKATGMLLLVDATTGKLLDKVSVAETTEMLQNKIKKLSM